MKRFLRKEVQIPVICLTAVLVFFICNRLTGQIASYSFNHITTNDGLPNGFINDMLQDKKGFMWFATWEGLVRYDGYNFVRFKPDLRDSSSISSKLVYSLAEDLRGGLWVGTTHGLNYFDKKKGSFHRFSHEPGNSQSLPGNWIIDLIFDQDSNLWVATDHGLSRLSLDENRIPIRFEHYQNHPDEPTSLPHNQVMSLAIDHRNHLWAGTMNGLVRITRSGELEVFPNLNDGTDGQGYSITALSEDKQHNLWVGTKGGKVYQWLRKEDRFHPLDEIGPYEPRSNKYVSSFCEDHLGNMWIGIFDGGLAVRRANGTVEQIQYHSEHPESLIDNSVKSLYLDRSGILWIGIKSLGLGQLDLYRKPFQRYRHQSDDPSSLKYNEIMAIEEDPIGRIWIGTHEGFEVFYPAENRFVRYENETGTISPLITDKIWSFYVDTAEKVMWIGGHYGLTRVQLTKPGPGGTSVWITGDLSSHFSHILLADPAMDPEKHQVRAIFKDESGLLWVGTYHGVFALRSSKDSVEIVHHFLHDPDNPHSLSNDIVISILQDSRGDLWFGTRDLGLNLWKGIDEQGKGRFTRFVPTKHHEHSLSGTEVACLHEDRRGNLWVGTNGGGLNLLRRSTLADSGEQSMEFEHFGIQEGLLADAVFGILEDEHGILWISTNQGLFKFDPDGQDGLPFTQFTREHGLTSNTFFTGSYHKSRTGKLYFGSQMGFIVFHPDSIRENPTFPQMVITQLEIFNQAISVGEERNGRILLTRPISETREIFLSHLDNNFTLEFAALSYASPENNKYAYQLEGYDEEWIYTDARRRFASYSNLKPGTYTFKVKGSNADNTWNETATSLIIHTATPPWKSWWATGLYGLVLLGFLYAFRYYTLNKIQLLNDLELQRQGRKKEQEVHQQKLSFFTQLSHEFRTPLTLIIGPVQELVGKGITLSKAEIRQHLKLIDFNAKHLLRLIDQLLYFSKSEQGHLQAKPESGELISFTQRVKDSFQYLARKKEILLEVETAHEELRLCLDWDKMEKILNNLISNALKYSNNQGRVTIKVFLAKEEEVILEVKDTGIGIAADQMGLIFNSFYQVTSEADGSLAGYGIGLALTKKLVELQKGRIQVESEEGMGTTFTIHLPFLPAVEEPWHPSRAADQVQIWIDDDLSFEPTPQQEPTAPDGATEGKPLLLIVDDHADIRAFLSHNLSQTYQILEAGNGQEALEMALRHVPTMIISDVMMPVMDGFQLCSHLKADDRTNHIPVILLTAKSAIEPRIKGIQAGADAYLSKPFHLRHLQVRIQQLIDLRAKLRKTYQKQLQEPAYQSELLSEDQLFLDKISTIIKNRMSDTSFKVGELEREIGMSHMQLYRKLKALTDQSANEFIRSVRLQHAATLLRTTHLNVNEVAYQTGFNSPSYFIKCFRKQFGVLPKVYGTEGKKQLS